MGNSLSTVCYEPSGGGRGVLSVTGAMGVAERCGPPSGSERGKPVQRAKDAFPMVIVGQRGVLAEPQS
jgi:hypothetical protein